MLAILGVSAGWIAATFAITTDAIALLFATLTIMLYLLVPWTAVNLVDYFFVRRGRYAITHLFMPKGIYGAWGIRGLAAYLIGFVATLPFFVLPDVYTGPAARALGGVDVGWWSASPYPAAPTFCFPDRSTCRRSAVRSRRANRFCAPAVDRGISAG